MSRMFTVNADGEVEATYLTHHDEAPTIEGPAEEPHSDSGPASGPLGGEHRPDRNSDKGWFPGRGEDEQRPWTEG